MKIINLRMYQVRKLKELELEKNIFNTEALMLILNKKFKTNDKRLLFKYLDAQDDDFIMNRKINIVNGLNSEFAYKNLDCLIIPEYAVAVDGKICGFAMPLIENHKNLGYMLYDDKIKLKNKLEEVHKLGNIIDKVHRTKGITFKMFFGDLNEYNFILDENKKMYAVDLDSSYIGQDMPVNNSYYLIKNKYIKKIPEKYQVKTNEYNEVIIPSINSDLYCYNMILLNTLAQNPMHKVDLDNYYNYLEYLHNNGVNEKLLESFNTIYLPCQNINPKDIIEEENNIYNRPKVLSYNSYKNKYNIK